MKSMPELIRLWRAFGDLPVTDDGRTMTPFLHFPRGTQREEVWHWFEAQNPEFSVAEMQGAKPWAG